jgi:hypothetical protein
MTLKKTAIVLALALVGWALCGATMGIGMATASLMNAMIIHALAAPVFFAGISWIYFTRYGYTAPLQTALIFVAFVITMDSFIVAMVINRSFEMFTSPLGTWIPFALIFASTWVTGRLVTRRSASRMAG